MSATQQREKKSVWTVDPAHTQVELAVKHMMITTVRGRFTDVAGEIVVDGGDPRRSSVAVTIRSASIDTRNADRDAHLRSGDFLDVEEHPEITFRSREIQGAHRESGDAFRVVGDLTIRGVTREVVLDAQYVGEARDPWGGTRAGFSASAEIDRRDFGLTWNQVLEAGGALVAHEVRIALEVQAVRQEEAAAAA